MKHNTDIENFHKKIDGHILLLAAYTKNNNFIKLIRSCRLKPYPVFSNDWSPSTHFEQHWVDEFGHSLKFDKTNHKIVLNDLSIKNTTTSTDLFYGKSISEIASDCKSILILENDFGGKLFYLVAFNCNDGYIRAFSYSDQWRKISPLLFGTKILFDFFNHMNSSNMAVLNGKGSDSIFNHIKNIVISPFPAKYDISIYFSNKNIINLIKENNGRR